MKYIKTFNKLLLIILVVSNTALSIPKSDKSKTKHWLSDHKIAIATIGTIGVAALTTAIICFALTQRKKQKKVSFVSNDRELKTVRVTNDQTQLETIKSTLNDNWQSLSTVISKQKLDLINKIDFTQNDCMTLVLGACDLGIINVARAIFNTSFDFNEDLERHISTAKGWTLFDYAVSRYIQTLATLAHKAQYDANFTPDIHAEQSKTLAGQEKIIILLLIKGAWFKSSEVKQQAFDNQKLKTMFDKFNFNRVQEELTKLSAEQQSRIISKYLISKDKYDQDAYSLILWNSCIFGSINLPFAIALVHAGADVNYLHEGTSPLDNIFSSYILDAQDNEPSYLANQFREIMAFLIANKATFYSKDNKDYCLKDSTLSKLVKQ